MFETWIWIVPAAVAGAGLWNPRAGLLVLAASLPLFGSPPGGPYLAALDVAGVAAILTAWRGGHAEPGPLDWPAAAFVAVCLVSLVPSPYQPPGWQPSVLLGVLRALPDVETWSALYSWRAATDLLLGWGLFIAVRRAFAGESPAVLARSLLIGLVGTALVGLASQSGVVSLAEFRPDSGPRLSSTFFNSGWFAEYIVLATPLALAALTMTKRWSKRLAFFTAALALACLALTLQRGAWVAALAQFLLWGGILAARGPGRWGEVGKTGLQVLGVMVLTALVFLTAGGTAGRLVERGRSLESGLSERVPLWAAAAEMTAERPLLGWGLGSFAPAYDLAHPPGSEGAAANRNTAHSVYLGVAAETGLLGLCALGLLGWTTVACLRRPTPGRETMALALGITLAGATVHGLVQYLPHVRSIGWLLWLLLGSVALVASRQVSLGSRRAAYFLISTAALLVPLRALLLEPPKYAGNRAFGFHELEGPSTSPFRWTQGHAAKSIPWTAERLDLVLANGHPKSTDRPVEVVVGIDGETVAKLQVSNAWESHVVEVGPPREGQILLTLDVIPTFRPFSDFRRYPDLAPSTDIRALGVAVSEPRSASIARHSGDSRNQERP